MGKQRKQDFLNEPIAIIVQGMPITVKRRYVLAVSQADWPLDPDDDYQALFEYTKSLCQDPAKVDFAVLDRLRRGITGIDKIEKEAFKEAARNEHDDYYPNLSSIISACRQASKDSE